MNWKIKPLSAPKLHDKRVLPISYFLAILIVAMVVSQLFTFERFPDVMSSQLGVDVGIATLLVSLIVIIEFMSLPFLLRMTLSPLFRILSMVCLWVWAGFWLVLLSLLGFKGFNGNSGILGDTLDVTFFVPLIFIWAAVCVLVIAVSWGMRPSFRRLASAKVK